MPKLKEVILFIIALCSTSIVLLILSINFAEAKQYNVTSYYKIIKIDGIECRQYFSYYDGKEHYISTVCNS
jgi:hypothetical protein